MRIRTAPRREHGFRVFPKLFGRLEILVVNAVIVVFALVKGVIPANLRAIFIIPAAIVGEQVLAISGDAQIPLAVVDKNRRPTMHDVPPHVVEVFPFGRGVDREGIVPATFRRAISTENFPVRKVLPCHWNF